MWGKKGAVWKLLPSFLWITSFLSPFFSLFFFLSSLSLSRRTSRRAWQSKGRIIRIWYFFFPVLFVMFPPFIFLCLPSPCLASPHLPPRSKRNSISKIFTLSFFFILNLILFSLFIVQLFTKKVIFLYEFWLLYCYHILVDLFPRKGEEQMKE